MNFQRTHCVFRSFRLDDDLYFRSIQATLEIFPGVEFFPAAPTCWKSLSRRNITA